MRTKILLLFSVTAFLFASCEKEQSLKPMATYVPANQKSVSDIIKEANPTLWANLSAHHSNARTADQVQVISGMCHLHPNWAYCCIKPVKAICCIEVVADGSLAADPSGTVDGVNSGTIEHVEGTAESLNATNALTDDRWLIINKDAGPTAVRISGIKATEQTDSTLIEYAPY